MVSHVPAKREGSNGPASYVSTYAADFEGGLEEAAA
jgi:hypothetical protein